LGVPAHLPLVDAEETGWSLTTKALIPFAPATGAGDHDETSMCPHPEMNCFTPLST
jgi:hypothetical protein